MLFCAFAIIGMRFERF